MINIIKNSELTFYVKNVAETIKTPKPQNPVGILDAKIKLKMVEQDKSDQFTVLDTLTLDQNICRIVRISPEKYLLASYHLNKEEQTKSGSIYAVSVTGEN